ncbi:TPA: hypothetical protein ACH3X1_005434 [Trebouxia sp. C0004]
MLICCTSHLGCGRQESVFEDLASQDLLPAILSRLDALRDFLRCSAVSKSWNAATQKLQLASLIIPGQCGDFDSDPIDVDGLPSTIQWLQEKHAQGAFAGIKILTVCLEHAYTGTCYHNELLQSHLRSILSIAGTWGTLQSCSLRGDFPIDLPASLLPKNLQQLDLDMESDQTVGTRKPLSLFNRFLNLQSLKLAPIDNIGDEDELHLQQYILNNPFPQLTSLSMPDVLLHLSPSCTLAACLPVLTDLHVCVYPRKAQAILAMKTLKFLCLTLLCKPGLDNDDADLTVYKGSKLQKLCIKGSRESLVTVTIEKVDLMFCCSLITVNHRWLENLRGEAVHFG